MTSGRGLAGHVTGFIIGNSRENAFMRTKADTMSGPLPHPVRIGAVSYLNSKPLIEKLDELAPQAEVILDYPSRLADGLSEGLLDVALIPSVESFRDPEYEVVSDACVAARGPVLSVKLYSRVHPGDVRRLALDEGSRTSAALVRIMLAEKYGVQPELESLPLGVSADESDADAVLLIGDRAIHSPPAEKFAAVWDLGNEWAKWTGLPFVFAMWTARRDGATEGLAEVLNRARNLGGRRLEEIARYEASRLGIAEETAIRYLTENLHYRLGSAERNGLRLFRQLAENNGIVAEQTEDPVAVRG